MNLWNLYSRFFYAPDDGTGAALDTGAPAGAETPATPVEEFDLESPLTQDTFDRAYVESLRAEAAKHRTGKKELETKYTSLIDGFDDPSDVEYLVSIARKAFDDPSVSAAEFRRIADNIEQQLGGKTPEAPSLLDDDEADADKPLTRADLDRIEHERAVDAAQAQIRKEAADLGYADENTHTFKSLMWLAANDKEVAGDISKAHAKLEAEREAIRKEAVEAYVKSVQEGADAFPSLSGGSGTSAPAGGANAPGAPKTFKDASASAMARIEAMSRAQ